MPPINDLYMTGSRNSQCDQQPRHELLTALIETFNSHGLSYCMLSGYDDELSDKESDLDFMLSAGDAQRLPLLLQEVADRTESLLVQAISHETTGCYFALVKQHNGTIGFLNPDATTDYRARARLLLRADEILRNRRRYANTFLPSREHEFTYYLIKKVVKCSINLAQLRRLRNLYQPNPAGCRVRILEFWSQRSVLQIVRAVQQLDLPWFHANLSALQLELNSSPCKEALTDRMLHLVRDNFRKIRRILHPTGLAVAIAGGSAEQQCIFAEALANALRPAFRRCHVVACRPNTGSLGGGAYLTRIVRRLVHGWTLRVELTRSTLLISYGKGAIPTNALSLTFNPLIPQQANIANAITLILDVLAARQANDLHTCRHVHFARRDDSTRNVAEAR